MDRARRRHLCPPGAELGKDVERHEPAARHGDRVELQLQELDGEQRRAKRKQPPDEADELVERQPRGLTALGRRGEADSRRVLEDWADRARWCERRREDRDLPSGPQVPGQRLRLDATRADGHDRPDIVGPAQRDQQLAAECLVVVHVLDDEEALGFGSRCTYACVLGLAPAPGHRLDRTRNRGPVPGHDRHPADLGLVRDIARHELDHHPVTRQVGQRPLVELGRGSHEAPPGDPHAGSREDGEALRFEER